MHYSTTPTALTDLVFVVDDDGPAVVPTSIKESRVTSGVLVFEENVVVLHHDRQEWEVDGSYALSGL